MGLKEFQIISRLGEGAFSSVWKVKRISDGQEYAMKKVKMTSLSDKEKENALNEVRILASIRNPFIVGYKEAFFEDNSMTLCIVMEYAGGGDIYNKIIQHQKAKTYFKEEDVWNYATQMILALKTLHDMKILHRDLKSANIFLAKDGKTVKLGDLNVSKVAKSNLVYTQTGTPYYASPEVWRDQPYDLKSDIWSLGCVLYEICALKPPFMAKDMERLFKKVQKGAFEKLPPQYSPELNNFVSLCLQSSPLVRPNCDKLLNYPIIRKTRKSLMLHLEELPEPNELLGTIKLPPNIKTLGDRLPKPNYNEELYSEQSEKSTIHRLIERERPVIYKRELRALSQHTPKLLDDNGGGLFIPKQLKIKSKLNPSLNLDILEEKEPVFRIRKNSVGKPRSMQEISPRISENTKHPRPQNYKVLRGRKTIESLESDIPQKHIPAPIQNRDDSFELLNLNNQEKEKRFADIRENKHLQVDRYEKMNPVQKSLFQKSKNRDYNQEEKYIHYKPMERHSYGVDEILNKRAEKIVKKYYADAALAEKREPLNELRRINQTPNNLFSGKDAIDILDRYNMHNLKEPGSRVSSLVRRENIYQRPENLEENHVRSRNHNHRNFNSNDSESNSKNHINLKQGLFKEVFPSNW